MIATTKKSSQRFQQFLVDYKLQLEQAIEAIKILDSYDPNSEEFTEALANLHVCATILEPYSEGMVDVINHFTEEMYKDE